MSSKRELTFRDHLSSIGRHRSASEVFRSFVRLAACAVGAGAREPEYLEEARRWEPAELESFAHAFAALTQEMERRPYQDLIGQYYIEDCQSKGARDQLGEFYTPPSLCKMMARMTVDPAALPEDRPLDLAEPCVGAGGMVLAVAEVLADAGVSPLRIRAHCMDISRLACDMAFLNLTLWGIPAAIVHGNTITLETWGQWTNPFWNLACGSSGVPFLEIEKWRNLLALITPAECDEEFAIEQAYVAALDKKGQFVMPLEAAS